MSTQPTPKPKFISLQEAAAMTQGTRITFIPGVPALFSEALKNICFVKAIPLIRVLHPMMGVDKDTGTDRQAQLYKLTKQTSLPTMLHKSGLETFGLNNWRFANRSATQIHQT